MGKTHPFCIREKKKKKKDLYRQNCRFSSGALRQVSKGVHSMQGLEDDV